MRNKVTALVISAACLVGIAGYEGYRASAYKDVGGVPTIGYGETKGVKMGDKTTPERALVQLLKSANTHADGIKKCIKVPLYQHEFDAYVSFAYNVGVGNFCNSTLNKKLNAGDYEGACKELLKWVYAGRREVCSRPGVCVKVRNIPEGLKRRRQSEYEMCLGVANARSNSLAR